jgi:thiol-disulfide isomerase/thioredoxin
MSIINDLAWENENNIPKEEPKSSCPKCRTTDFDNCHSIHCPMRKEESLQETLEEVAERLFNNFQKENPIIPKEDIRPFKLGFIKAVKWQQERMYSEEEVLNFTQTILMQYKFGNTNIEQMDLLKETLEQFKKK